MVTYEEGEKFAQEHGLNFVEASAKLHENVEKVIVSQPELHEYLQNESYSLHVVILFLLLK